MFSFFLYFQKYESIEVCQKSVFQLDLVKNECDTEFGFAVEAELAEDIERDDELRLYVSNVLHGGIAHRTGNGYCGNGLCFNELL